MSDKDNINCQAPFSMVPEWVIVHPGLSAGGVRLYALLMRYANYETSQAFPKLETLAERLHVSTRNIQRWREELTAVGALTVKRRRDSSNLYTVMLMPLEEDERDPENLPCRPEHRRKALELREWEAGQTELSGPVDTDPPDRVVRRDRTDLSGGTGQICPPNENQLTELLNESHLTPLPPKTGQSGTNVTRSATCSAKAENPKASGVVERQESQRQQSTGATALRSAAAPALPKAGSPEYWAAIGHRR